MNSPGLVPTHPRTSLPNPGVPRGKEDDNGRGPHYTPWLLLRYQVGDAGNRPLPPGTVFWESPDIWTQGSQGINQPVVNQPTQVFARITNLGMEDATGVTIQYWWENPSIAFVQSPTNLIGQITGATIPSNNSVVFQCPNDWVPIEVNGGHECLVVEAFILVFDPLTDPMQPVDDRHVGQKNEQLLTLPAGQSFKFKLSAHNFTAADQQVVVEARPGIIPRNFAQRFGTPGMWRTELLDPGLALPVEIHVDAKPVRTAAPAERTSRRLAEPRRTLDVGCLGPAQASAAHVFGPREVRNVTITGALPHSARPGEVYVIRIIQRIGQVVAGGYTLYITLKAG